MICIDFLAGEAVLAEPAAYARLIAGKVGEHLRDLESWRSDQIVLKPSTMEFATGTSGL